MPSPHKEKLREDFKKECFCEEEAMNKIGASFECLYEKDKISDWWLSHTISKAELREWAEEHKIQQLYPTIDERPDPQFAGYNQALSDLLEHFT